MKTLFTRLHLSLLFFTTCFGTVFAQAPVISPVQGASVICVAPSSSEIYSVSAINTPTSYSWTYVGGGLALVLSPSGSICTVNFSSNSVLSTYTLLCYASNGNGNSATVAIVINAYANPSITFSGAQSFCQGSSTQLSASSTIFQASSTTLSYNWSPSTGLSSISSYSVFANPPTSTNYSVLVTNGPCAVTSTLTVNSLGLPPALSINGNSTVCLGSSINLSASGATSYTWSTGALTSSITIFPSFSASYSVTGINANGCIGTAIVPVTVNAACSDVWPGDANSDGLVNTLDVLELGYAYAATGAPRTSGSNAFTAQYAANWTGTVSSGKNKCHADCNGDGSVDHSDTTAIYLNFSQTHAFKSSASSASALRFVSEQENQIIPGEWNTLNILAGDSANPFSLYGLVFDINYLASAIESDSAYLRFTPSFFNQNDPTVWFGKNVTADQKLYAAMVKTNGSDVNGYGKIASFHFKAKLGLAENSNYSFGLTNISTVYSDKHFESVGDNSISLFARSTAVGIKNYGIVTNNIRLYPNPAKNVVTLQSDVTGSFSYIICDLTGRKVFEGTGLGTTTINVSKLEGGVYILNYSGENMRGSSKLIIQDQQ